MTEITKTYRLSKIASEINISVGSIVQFLSIKGIKVDNNPNAKIPQDIYDIILKEYNVSKVVKEPQISKKENVNPVIIKTTTNKLDIEIYKSLINDINVSEIYLSHIPFPFHYSQAEYTATCTEAFPFDPFDKVICELLKVEESLSMEEIGDILGMNVYSSENPKRYLDLAEREILIEALQSLSSSEFGMIQGGDINYSRCRLTSIGREYAQKKNKFKTTTNKPFTIFLDHTTGDSINAKKHFEFANGKAPANVKTIDLPNEKTLKEIVAVQAPEIYDPIKQFSFTNAVLSRKKDLVIEYLIAITYDIIEKSYRFYCYNNDNKIVINSFTDWLNGNESIKQQLIDKFSLNTSSESILSNSSSSQIIKQFSNYSENSKIQNCKHELLNNEFIDELLFYSSFSELIDSKEKIDLYLCLPFITEEIYTSLIEIVQKSENINSRFFFIFPYQLSLMKVNYCSQFESFSCKLENVYIMYSVVRSFTLICKKQTASFYIDSFSCVINNFSKNFFQRKPWDSSINEYENYLLEKFSDIYVSIICNKVNDTVNIDIVVANSKEQFDKLSSYELKLNPFVNIDKYYNTICVTLDLIDKFRKDRIALLKVKVHNHFEEIKNKLSSIDDEKKFLEVQKEFNKAVAEIIFNDPVVLCEVEDLNNLIAQKKLEFDEAKKSYSFIIDTNVFIKDPEIISKIPASYKVIIAAKVIDELDGFKANPQLKEVASKSIREIFIDKNKNIRRAKANLKLLPPDFNKRSPDNFILAVAIMYKDTNGILITDDKGLHEKAKTIEMQVMTYEGFISKFVTSKR